MRLISHRGNINGRKPELENQPSYVQSAIYEGYDVEIDLWYKDGFFFLGHDEPQYEISLKWLTSRHMVLWIHCKNLETIEVLKNLENELGLIKLNYFFHQKDDVTITSQGNLWAYPGKQPLKHSVAVQPEWYDDDVTECWGICSDNIEKYIKDGFKKRNTSII